MKTIEQADVLQEAWDADDDDDPWHIVYSDHETHGICGQRLKRNYTVPGYEVPIEQTCAACIDVALREGWPL